MSFSISKGNVDDRIPVCDLVKDLHGSLIGYRGYIDFKLFEDLMAKDLKLITRIKTNMKNKLVPLIDKILLRKRSIIETINDQLKNIYQIEHTRHRSHIKFLVNLFSLRIILNTIQSNKYGNSPKKLSVWEKLRLIVFAVSKGKSRSSFTSEDMENLALALMLALVYGNNYLYRLYAVMLKIEKLWYNED